MDDGPVFPLKFDVRTAVHQWAILTKEGTTVGAKQDCKAGGAKTATHISPHCSTKSTVLVNIAAAVAMQLDEPQSAHNKRNSAAVPEQIALKCNRSTWHGMKLSVG